mmetsp:Transcript_25452/g.48101  ORF Transcript_25452/g.48101 Transcript_25452/m.48101 type:complete len:201 (+) Transcript_25452:546-1148(+)
MISLYLRRNSEPRPSFLAPRLRGNTSTTTMVKSSHSPRCLTAICARRAAASLVCLFRTAMIACSGFSTESHSPSEATMMRPPCVGSFTLDTCGTARMLGPTSASPRLRARHSPPGHARSGPTSRPRRRRRCTRWPPSNRRFSSSGLVAMRWSAVSCKISLPESTKHELSPTLPAVTVQPLRKTEVAVQPDIWPVEAKSAS